MNDEKEPNTQEASEDWWVQYLSEEEKRELQPDAVELEESVEEEVKAVPKWKIALDWLKENRVKVSTTAILLLLVCHWGVVNVKLLSLKREHHLVMSVLDKSDHKYDLKSKEVREAKEELALSRKLLIGREAQLAACEKQIEEHSAVVDNIVKRWDASIGNVVDLTQEIYALKTEARYDVLQAMEGEMEREQKIHALWSELAELLKGFDEFESERATIEIRVAQAQVYSNLASLNALDKCDWRGAELEGDRAKSLSRIYYKKAQGLLAAGSRGVAASVLQRAEKVSSNLKIGSGEASYIQGKLVALSSELRLRDNPKDALEDLGAAIELLENAVEEEPKNCLLRKELMHLCQQVCATDMGDSHADLIEESRGKARAQAVWLIENSADSACAHLLIAQLDSARAERCLRNGDDEEAERLLKKAKVSLKVSGGDVVTEASLNGVRAFILWNKGYRTSAVRLLDSELQKLDTLIENGSSCDSSRYRSAALLWERGMMQLDQNKALTDGVRAVEQLSEVIGGAGSVYQMPASRMSALVLCDLAEIKLGMGDRSTAREFLIRSESLWEQIAQKYGVSEEDRGVAQWCKRQLAQL
jgi:tetratricopeptide (TPR) repeat protein